MSSGIMSEQMIKDAENYLNFDDRYEFFDPPIRVRYPAEPIRILVMARRSGGEGNRSLLDENGNSSIVPGRNLLFETLDGKMSSGRFPEERLERMFAEAGLDLGDYTFESPPPPDQERSGYPAGSENVPLGGPNERRPVPLLDQATEANSHEGQGSDNRNAGKIDWVWAIALVALGILVLGFIVNKMSQRRL